MEGTEEEISSDSRRQLQFCLDVLHNANTDTEKFAALLMLSKVVKAGDCLPGDRQQIMDAVGISFLVRLLRTKKAAEGCSVWVYKSVAVCIVQALVEDPNVACSPEMSDILPHLKDIITTDVKKETDEEGREMLQELQRTVYSVVARVACSPGGARSLLDCRYQSALVSVLAADPDEDLMMMTMATLMLLMQQFGAATWQSQLPAFDDLFAVMAGHIIKCQDSTLFDMCDLTAYVLQFAPERDSQPKCVQPLMEKLSSLLKSKLGVVQRQQVMAVVNGLVLHLGLQCLRPPSVTDPRLLQLVLSLTCVEIRITVENSTAHEIGQRARWLCSHYLALEVMLGFLCEGDTDGDLPLEAEAFSQAHDALLAACSGVLFFLQQVHSGAMDIPLHHPVVAASVRLVSAIASQAFTEVKDSVVLTMPLLLKLCSMEAGPVQGSELDPSTEQSRPKRGRRTTHQASNTPRNLTQGCEHADDLSGHGQTLAGCNETSTRDEPAKSALPREEHGGTEPSYAAQTANQGSGSNNASEEGVDDVKDVSERSAAESRGQSNAPRTNRGSGADNLTGVERQSQGSLLTDVSETAGQSDNGQSAEELERSGCDAVGDGGDGEVGGEVDCLQWLSEADVLPVELGGVLRLMQVLSQTTAAKLRPVNVIRLLLPVFCCSIQDHDVRRVFVELSGCETLIHFLLKKKLEASSDKSTGHQQTQAMACTALDVLTQLLLMEEGLAETKDFTLLFHAAVTQLCTLEERLDAYVYRAYLSGLVLVLACGLAKFDTQREGLGEGLRSAVTFVCRAAPGTAGTGPGRSSLQTTCWPDVRDVWETSVDALTWLVSPFPQLIDLVLEAEFIPKVTTAMAQQPAGSVLTSNNIAVVMGSLEALALTDGRAASTLKSNNGSKLARIHGFGKLENYLSKAETTVLLN